MDMSRVSHSLWAALVRNQRLVASWPQWKRDVRISLPTSQTTPQPTSQDTQSQGAKSPLQDTNMRDLTENLGDFSSPAGIVECLDLIGRAQELLQRATDSPPAEQVQARHLLAEAQTLLTPTLPRRTMWDKFTIGTSVWVHRTGKSTAALEAIYSRSVDRTESCCASAYRSACSKCGSIDIHLSGPDCCYECGVCRARL